MEQLLSMIFSPLAIGLNSVSGIPSTAGTTSLGTAQITTQPIPNNASPVNPVTGRCEKIDY
jgi:hypothetical protein